MLMLITQAVHVDIHIIPQRFSNLLPDRLTAVQHNELNLQIRETEIPNNVFLGGACTYELP